jgi:protoglobin
MSGVDIPGYTYGTGAVAKSPVTPDDLVKLEQAVGLTDEDRRFLRLAGDVLQDQAEAIVDHWRSIIAEQPHLAFYSQGPDAEAYKVAVKRRFVQWVLDTCRRPHDQVWLDYQEEIGLRHTRTKKNCTDNAQTPPHIPLRYVLAFTATMNATIRPFLAKKGHSSEEVERMHEAWCKAVTLQITLWSRPYAKEGDW